MFGSKILPLVVIFCCLLSLSKAFSNSVRATAFSLPKSASNLRMGLIDDVSEGFNAFRKRFTQKATASHILIKGGAEAQHKLEDLKAEIENDYSKFAEAARQYSECPSAKKGGNLGAFGPGAMVKPFDEVVFNEEVGIVHGPVPTQFGYHLIMIHDRTDG
jgi:peptidyl-prolyl cis-trans isomerase C